MVVSLKYGRQYFSNRVYNTLKESFEEVLFCKKHYFTDVS